ncbi:MAG: polysaccharide deacetylase [Clostridiales bacterium]|nr:polysaccharide deacetylase [Clostridiales bacterium]
MNTQKLKILTFSFDDGVTQDRRLVELFNRYGMKCTFNINSGLLGLPGTLGTPERPIQHNKIQPEEVGTLYRGHEVAVHTVTHPRLPEIEDEEVIYHQVEDDRLELERLSGGPVVGMAYPCGGVNNDDRVAEIIGRRTPIRYARTITSSGDFEFPANPLRMNPSVHAINFDDMMELGRKFIDLKPERPQMYYIWGHSYEFDLDDGWNRFEAFCKMMAGQDDIAYLTNRDALL